MTTSITGVCVCVAVCESTTFMQINEILCTYIMYQPITVKIV